MAASVGLTLTLAATLVYIAWPRVAGALGVTSVSAPASPVYAAGETIDAPAAWYSTAPYTLILFARKSCVACEKAQPFIKTLIASVEGRAAAVMAHPDGAESSEADDRDYAKAVGIADSATFVTPAGLKVRATPTLVLVDRQGRVLHAWEGVGNTDKQAQITGAVGAALR
jgi:thioredoxin-related protein